MKLHTIKTICILSGGLFTANALALAQAEPSAPASAVPHYSSESDSSYVKPKTTSPNFYLEAGFTYMNAKTKGDDQDLYGGTLALGWRLDKASKVQIEVGGLFGDDTSDSEKNEFTVTTLLLSASACMPLGQKEQWELRLTPAIGFYSMKWQVKDAAYGYGSTSGNDTDTAFAWGGGVGITYHINKRFYVDTGYRYLRVGSTEYKIIGYKAELDSMNTHSAIVSLGWKF